MSKLPSTETDVPVDRSRRSVLRAVAGAGLMSAATTPTHQQANGGGRELWRAFETRINAFPQCERALIISACTSSMFARDMRTPCR